MRRTVFTGGRLFDGTGAPAGDGDIVIADGRVVEVDPVLTATRASTVAARPSFPASSTATCM